MFEFVRTHGRWLQAILLLLILPSFVAMGVMQGYQSFMANAGSRVATVEGVNVTQTEWDAAVRDQADRVRRQNPNVDPKLLDSPEARKAALQNLVNQRVLVASAARQQLEVADQRLKSSFARDENLVGLRNPDGSVNKSILAAQGMTTDVFIQRYRQDLTMRQILSPVQTRGAEPQLPSKLALDAFYQRRELSIKRVDPDAFKAQVQISDAELKAQYDKPEVQKRWQRPESARIEYLVFEPAALQASVKVDEATLKDLYAKNSKRFGTPEERSARHILIQLAADAKPDEEKAARAKAEDLLAQLKKDPKQFAALARKHSQDPGSADSGGELPFFAREAMVKPFSDAAFSLKVGEISGIVRSEYGLHLITVTGVRGGDVRSFEQVRAELEAEYRAEQAKKEFAAKSEAFSTMVDTRADTLQPVAEKFGLKVQTADVQRQPQPGSAGLLASAKLLEEVFSEDSLRNKGVSLAIETAPQQLVSARVLKHVPSAAPPLEEVREALKAEMTLERAAALAKKDGESQLAALLKAPESGSWDAPKWVSRAATMGLPRPALDAALRADASKLPAVLGVDLGNAGYLLLRVTKTAEPDAAVLKPEQARAEYAQVWATAEAQAYLDALKTATKAKILVKIPTETSK